MQGGLLRLILPFTRQRIPPAQAGVTETRDELPLGSGPEIGTPDGQSIPDSEMTEQLRPRPCDPRQRLIGAPLLQGDAILQHQNLGQA